MENFALYRRRLIPNECVHLADDRIVSFENGRLVTVWSAIRPKKNLHHGISCFFFDEHIKLSKFYRADNSLIYWYIDIISADVYPEGPKPAFPYHIEDSVDLEALKDGASLVVTDLLADILIYPDGFVKVVDLGEISDALEEKLLDEETAASTLRITDRTLEKIYRGEFQEEQKYLEKFEHL